MTGASTREYGLGRKRTDLLVQWPLDTTQGFLGPVQRMVIELKLLHKSLDATLRKDWRKPPTTWIAPAQAKAIC